MTDEGVPSISLVSDDSYNSSVFCPAAHRNKASFHTIQYRHGPPVPRKSDLSCCHSLLPPHGDNP